MARVLAYVGLLAVFCAGTLQAAPARYLLDRAATNVGFEVDFGPDAITGIFPVKSVDIVLDFDRAANSSVAVILDVTAARANFPFATQAMQGPKVLDARGHPELIFRSTSVQATGEKAIVSGDITIRGVTRPIDLEAQTFRPSGTQPGDRSRVLIKMTGAVARSAFGATGWNDLVGDEVRLDIQVWVTRSE